jgi:antitoxin (DNA-binding transcriptional repressor) of toxin-antitoxin stability system
MSDETTEVSAFEAKTRLAELLRETERGASFLIRRRGRAVARLVPPGGRAQEVDPASILASFRALRKRARGPVKVRELIDAGRRR